MFKSSAAPLGAMRLSGLCEEREQLGRAGDIIVASDKAAQVIEEHTRTVRWLEKRFFLA